MTGKSALLCAGILTALLARGAHAQTASMAPTTAPAQAASSMASALAPLLRQDFSPNSTDFFFRLCESLALPVTIRIDGDRNQSRAP